MLRNIAVRAAIISLIFLAPTVASGDSPHAPIGHLVLSEPVIFINGPFTPDARTVKVGQTVIVQISYPIAPPFPKSARVDSGNGGFFPVGIFRTDGEVTVLTPEPKRGRIGVGFLSVVAKAVKRGRTTLKARIELADGTVKEVPIIFAIEDGR